eukprot:TRINITY_DN23019_c0_g1_i1.p1 TRINITY_DN23019_c0_g1~~TRINITY_DN23019_c0_g1_i1.p1  ORF type:complete len:321 (+),score=99.08 TRINITY_DN23019_c0_g1_i1:61-1023(+)
MQRAALCLLLCAAGAAFDVREAYTKLWASAAGGRLAASVAELRAEAPGTCGWLSSLHVRPDLPGQLIGSGFLSGRIYEIDVRTQTYSVLTEMVLPHGTYVTEDSVYATEIALGRVMRYDFATGNTTNAFPSENFLFPARLLGVNGGGFLVSEPVLGKIAALSPGGAAGAWERATFSTGLNMPDAITWGPNGTLLVAAWTEGPLGAELSLLNATTGARMEAILHGDLYLPTGLRYYDGKIYVAEMGPLAKSRVSVLARNAAGVWARERALPLAWPTGLDVARDPVTNRTTLYVVGSLESTLYKYDVDANYTREVVTRFECL